MRALLLWARSPALMDAAEQSAAARFLVRHGLATHLPDLVGCRPPGASAGSRPGVEHPLVPAASLMLSPPDWRQPVVVTGPGVSEHGLRVSLTHTRTHVAALVWAAGAGAT